MRIGAVNFCSRPVVVRRLAVGHLTLKIIQLPLWRQSYQLSG